jgi:UDP-galactopyranose mutase
MSVQPTVIVFSHLRWDSVFQRPHQLLTRIATSRRVVFIEEPRATDQTQPHWDITNPTRGITVCTPRTSCSTSGFCGEQVPLLQQLLPDLLEELQLESYTAWFYTPLAVPLLDVLAPEAIVYDCMDALDKFSNASPDICSREKELLDRANLVFTGGPSLHRRMEGRHPNSHCFPSSVDAKHFATATEGHPDPESQAELATPRLGYFGVIDERLNLDLIETIAIQRPHWQIVMIGPVVKISTESLPKRQNIHYLGQQSYRDLPAFVGGWDVCLMPFALNDATEFISPTKVLEYMAAQKPIVSTSTTDVAVPFSDIVHLADSPDEFLAACDNALAATPGEQQRRQDLMNKVLSNTSWDLTVEQMLRLLDDMAGNTGAETAGALLQESHASATYTTQSVDDWGADVESKPPFLVVGAGPTGLSAAYHLGTDCTLLEQNETIGGLCRSIDLDGYTFDYAGHIMFSKDPYVHSMYEALLGDNLHWQDREAWIYSKQVYTRYPFQGALYGLPADVIRECIMGAIEAQYGTSKPQQSALPSNGCSPSNGTNGHGVNGKHRVSKQLDDCCGDGILESTTSLANGNGQPGMPKTPLPNSESFEEFIYRVWGDGIAKHFAIPYNKKLWAVPLSEMETSWLGGRVPMPDLGEMVEGALSPVPKAMGPNARFGYPLRGGFQALMDGFLPFVGKQLKLNSGVRTVSALAHEVELTDGTVIPYRKLISTMPLPILIRALGDEAPAEVCDAVSNLRYVSVRCVHLGIGREDVTEKHWIYYPEDSVFHRIFVQGNASPHCNAPGGFGLTCEITYSPHKPLPCDGDELIERTIADCRKVGIFGEEDPVVVATQVDLPFAYVVYDHDRAKNVKLIRDWLSTQDIILAGRYSEWEYYNSDHAFIAGKRAAEQARELLDVPAAAAGYSATT